jgi:hypothetical protein
MTYITINNKTNKFLFFNYFLNLLLYVLCITLLCVFFFFFAESFFLFAKFKTFRFLNLFNAFFIENFSLLNTLNKVEIFNVAYSKVELFNVVYRDFILALLLFKKAVFQFHLLSLPSLSLIGQCIEQGFSYISKAISEPTLTLNSEFLKKENFLNTKDIFQSFESRFGFKVSDTICTKRCFELMKVEPYLPSPYLTILSAAYREEDCWSANSTYPWDIKKLVDVQTYACDIRQLEKEMSNVLKALSSDLNQKQQTQLDQSSLEFFV